MMRIVFWQNCLSPHQLPYIVHLMDDERVDKVVIAVGCTVANERKRMGWDTPSISGLEKCDVYIDPSPQTVNYLFEERETDSIHLFSGIRGFDFVFSAFKASVNFNIRRGLVTERPNTFAFGQANGKPLWLHWLRYQLQDRKYISLVSYVFAMGEEAVKFFRSLNKSWEVFSFAYCTNHVDTNSEKKYSDDASTKFCFVGSLSWWKNTSALLTACVKCKNISKRGKITLFGDGNQKMQLKKYAKKHSLNNVFFAGTQQSTDIPKLLSNQDVLILPSIYDGWGAVINEALQQGLYVICSERCGAKELLSDKRMGMVFESDRVENLSECMSYCMDNIDMIRNDRRYRKEWAEHNISGKVIARYMVDCLEGKAVKAPWIADKI